MEKGELLNRLFESGMSGDEAQAIISDPTFDRLRDSDDNWLYNEQEKENPSDIYSID